jgi:hypothetical protein
MKGVTKNWTYKPHASNGSPEDEEVRDSQVASTEQGNQVVNKHHVQSTLSTFILAVSARQDASVVDAIHLCVTIPFMRSERSTSINVTSVHRARRTMRSCHVVATGIKTIIRYLHRTSDKGMIVRPTGVLGLEN